MSNYMLNSIKLASIAACVPKHIDFTRSYDLFTPEEAILYEKRTGVKSKHTSNGRYTTSDLCLHAAEKTLLDLRWKPEDIGLLLFISQTPDYALPSTSVILQGKLGLPADCMSLDIRLGCTGWVTGLSIAGGLMKTFGIAKALLLNGETNILSNYSDTSTYPLMGDAGTATALELDVKSNNIFFNFSSPGDKFDAIIAPRSGARYISEKNDPAIPLSIQTSMSGTDIYEFVLLHVLPSITNLLNEVSLSVNDIDHFVFHQANKLIIESLRKKLNIPLEKSPYSLTDFGNTSSASIPLTLLTQIRSFKGKSRKIFCSSFGVGLSLANVIIETDELFCADLIEI